MEKIVIIGTGNAAWHFAKAFSGVGSQIVQIVGRNKEEVNRFSEEFFAEQITDIRLVRLDADLYIIAVSDAAIQEVASYLRVVECCVIHLSGTMAKTLLSGSSQHYGVVYSPQTFVKHQYLNYEELTFCLDPSDEKAGSLLHRLFSKISSRVIFVSSEQRTRLHIAAVMVSNFVNALYWMAEDVLESSGISFSLLFPLILETAEKPICGNAKQLQTGPARRGDGEVIRKHLLLLEGMKEQKQVYQLFSEIIKKEFSDRG